VGKFVFRSVNYGYQGISKEFLKKWRPITLLNSTYKLASSCIAERITSVLSHLISTDQTGFIPGRYIGENCRLIYDILHFTGENDIPGILLLIDFEKEFDSIFLVIHL
jgi:hypothetical protein